LTIVALAADRAGDWSFWGTRASRSTTAMFIPIPARAQAAAASFIGVDYSTWFLNVPIKGTLT
jgi:hypothetical protein